MKLINRIDQSLDGLARTPHTSRRGARARTRMETLARAATFARGVPAARTPASSRARRAPVPARRARATRRRGASATAVALDDDAVASPPPPPSSSSAPTALDAKALGIERGQTLPPVPPERVHWVCDVAGVEAMRAAVLSDERNPTTAEGHPPVVGLDGEWKPGSRTPVSILQVATRADAFVVDLFATAPPGRARERRPRRVPRGPPRLRENLQARVLVRVRPLAHARVVPAPPKPARGRGASPTASDDRREAGGARREREPDEHARRPRDADEIHARRDAVESGAVLGLVQAASDGRAAVVRRRGRVLPLRHLRQVRVQVEREGLDAARGDRRSSGTRERKGNISRGRRKRRSRSKPSSRGGCSNRSSARVARSWGTRSARRTRET